MLKEYEAEAISKIIGSYDFTSNFLNGKIMLFKDFPTHGILVVFFFELNGKKHEVKKLIEETAVMFEMVKIRGILSEFLADYIMGNIEINTKHFDF